MPTISTTTEHVIWMALGQYGALQAWAYLEQFSMIGALIVAVFLAQASGSVVAYLSEETDETSS